VILTLHVQKHVSLRVIVDHTQAESGTLCHKLMLLMGAKFSLCDQFFRLLVIFVQYMCFVLYLSCSLQYFFFSLSCVSSDLLTKDKPLNTFVAGLLHAAGLHSHVLF